jgi:hypothetical protein
VLTPRRIIVASIVLFAAQAAILAIYGMDQPGPVLSGAFQLVMGLLCLIAPLMVARSGGTFERRFLMLVAGRYVIWGAAQSLATYNEIDGNLDFSGSLADILFHLEDVPLGIAFFLDPGRESDRVERPRLFDLAQILVFFAAVALYIRYLTSDSDAGVGGATATHALVAGCFYIRAMTSRSTAAAALFGRWTPAILLAAVNDAYSGYYNSSAGEWFDLVWALEMVLWIVTAATWSSMRLERGTSARRTVDRTVYLLPLVVGTFSVVVGIGIAQRKLALGALLVAAAVGCSAARFLARRRSQQERSVARATGR